MTRREEGDATRLHRALPGADVARVTMRATARRVRAALLSRLWLVLVLSAGLVGTLWGLQTLNSSSRAQLQSQAAASAGVLVAGLIAPHLQPAGVAAGRLDTQDTAELHASVAALRQAGQLEAVSVWAADGRLLFDDGPAGGAPRRPHTTAAPAPAGTPGPTPARTPAAAGGPEAWGVTAPDGALEVFIGQPVAGAAPVLVEVVIPRALVRQAFTAPLLRRQVGAVVAFALLAAGLLCLRWRLRRRDRHARHDPLTGLLNRRALHEDAPRLLDAASSRRPLGVLLIDLVAFKSVNDTLGHAAGDQLLEQVAATLIRSVRPTDVVVRLGGDEFAVLLPELRAAGDAAGRAEQLLASLRRASFTVEGVELTVDASIGVAIAPEHGQTLPELLQHADVAMYTAKGAHRGTAVYDPAADQHTVGTLAMVAELRHALENGEFVLHYQPKIALPGGAVTGVEALIRWQHPTRGLLPPAEFLPLAETTGLMPDISRWVLREAVHQAASWRRAGMPVKVAVNISPRGLLDYDLPARALSALLSADLPASLLEIEITETAVTINPERAAYVLTQLRGRGISVAIDDFGAGYTSLAFLRVLPATALKIDRSLVTHLLDCPEDEAVTAAVIDLAHRLGLQVIAEGVETDALRHRLADLGCDQAQGYGISRPMPAAACEGWFTAECHTGQPGATSTPVGKLPTR